MGASQRTRPGVSESFSGVPVVFQGPVHGMVELDEHLAGPHLRIGDQRIGNMNAVRRRAPLAWVPSP